MLWRVFWKLSSDGKLSFIKNEKVDFAFLLTFFDLEENFLEFLV